MTSLDHTCRQAERTLTRIVALRNVLMAFPIVFPLQESLKEKT